MSLSNAAENALLLLLFNNTAFALVGDAAGLQPSAAAGSLYVSLHTADPGEAGTQATSECAYTGYARVAVARSGAGWTVATNTAVNAALVTFPIVAAAPETVTYFGIGTSAAGAGVLLVSGVLSNSFACAVGATPQVSVGGLIVSAD